MYELLKHDDLYDKVGGPFKLTRLIQKRLAALVKGAKPLVDIDTDDKMQIVLEEIRQGKIGLKIYEEGKKEEVFATGDELDFDETEFEG